MQTRNQRNNGRSGSRQRTSSTRSGRKRNDPIPEFWKSGWFWVIILVLIALLSQCSKQANPALFLNVHQESVTLNKNFNAKIIFDTDKNNNYYITDQKKNQKIKQGKTKSGTVSYTVHSSGKYKITVYRDGGKTTSKVVTVKPLKVSQNQINATMNDAEQSSTTNNSQQAPAEYQSALKKAKEYSDKMYMSKAGIYDQLTSAHGTQYSANAAQYAVDNLNADYQNNALQKAKQYKSQFKMSSNSIKDQLTSKAGDQFTEDEANYAIEHIGN